MWFTYRFSSLSFLFSNRKSFVASIKIGPVFFVYQDIWVPETRILKIDGALLHYYLEAKEYLNQISSVDRCSEWTDLMAAIRMKCTAIQFKIISLGVKKTSRCYYKWRYLHKIIQALNSVQVMLLVKEQTIQKISRTDNNIQWSFIYPYFLKRRPVVYTWNNGALKTAAFWTSYSSYTVATLPLESFQYLTFWDRSYR